MTSTFPPKYTVQESYFKGITMARHVLSTCTQMAYNIEVAANIPQQKLEKVDIRSSSSL
jgi:hypothetical protein